MTSETIPSPEPPARAAHTNVPARRKLAIIDIGSNSVRLVVYDVEMRVPFQIFNERVLCGLGRGVARTGHLDPKGRDSALNTIRRFCALATEMQVVTILAVGTAAVRDAEDGPEFVRTVESLCGVAPRVLTGKEEARYSALGVVAGIRGTDGIVGDLGGGSLEIVDLVEGQPQSGTTLPFGPLQLMDRFASDRKSAIAAIDAELAKHPWLAGRSGRSFYAVGGAWRSMAQVHMEHEDYPLHILHQYTIPRRKALDLCNVIAGLSANSLKRIKAVSKKRAVTLPYAALVLSRILKASNAESMVVSSFGLREGLAHDWLLGEESDHDLFLEMCRELARSRGRFGDHGDEIMDWIAPLFPAETEAERRLRHGACLLSDIGWSGHPDYRAEIVLHEVLHSQLVGVGHADKAFVALALYVCYGGNVGSDAHTDTALRLLDEEMVKKARILGLALRLAQRISGGTEGILEKCALEHGDGQLVLRVPADNNHLVSEVVERRLKHLAKALGHAYTIRA
jgi:exopolyphosphatase/guanosine-5'-triphosphate,3'-diphosphate pyrophosphatase